MSPTKERMGSYAIVQDNNYGDSTWIMRMDRDNANGQIDLSVSTIPRFLLNISKPDIFISESVLMFCLPLNYKIPISSL